MRRMTLVLLPIALAGCLPINQGLESQHKPIVQNGQATVPGCPDWSSQGIDSAAMTDSNYGCATISNRAAMIADPNDLFRGATPAPGGDPTVSVRAIGAWRAGTTATTQPAAAGGAAQPRSNP